VQEILPLCFRPRQQAPPFKAVHMGSLQSLDQFVIARLSGQVVGDN
jgi:hypothetical protein